MIQAVNVHQGLLRASIASPGQDHRLGANEAPPAIMSIFLGAELEKVFGAIERGEAGESTPGSFLGLGTQVLPPLPMHGGDRNRTSPFAFTGNKFEFRALGSSQSLSLPNTVLNTIVAEAIDNLAGELENELKAGKDVEGALRPILQRSYAANKNIIFGGDNYAEEWHAEAEQRGLLNLRATPDALPYLISDETTTLFSNYGVLSQRELESRCEVFAEQYVTKINIESETAASIARTMLLPAAARHLALLREASLGELVSETEGLIDEFIGAIRHSSQRTSRRANRTAMCSSTASTCATRSSRRWRRRAMSPTGSRRWSPTTSGRCRSTRRSCSSSRPGLRDPICIRTVRHG